MPTINATLRPPTQRSKPAFVLLLSAIACGGEPFQTKTAESQIVPDVRFVDVTPAQWNALKSKRILFGHQSVGSNIVQGVDEILARHSEIELRVVEVGLADTLLGPGLYHAKIGQNGDPRSKHTAFSALVGSVPSDVAMMKFCYLDVDGRTNPDSLFTAYSSEVERLRAFRPSLRIVHVTMPLTDQGNWKERLVKTLRRSPSARELNRTRNRYNELLRANYVGKDPVFDLALLESTRADGSRVYFVDEGKPIYYLAPELTDDGGHLNPEGRRIVAEYFLSFLATL